MGVTAHRDFKKIKYFVNHLKASRGKFEILEEFELLTQQHNRINDGAVNHTLVLGESKNLALYREEFEKPIVDDTRTYCQGLRRVWLASESLPSYLQKAQEVLEQESDRVDRSIRTNTDCTVVMTVVDLFLCLTANVLAKLRQIQVLASKFEECFAESGRRGTS